MEQMDRDIDNEIFNLRYALLSHYQINTRLITDDGISIQLMEGYKPKMAITVVNGEWAFGHRGEVHSFSMTAPAGLVADAVVKEWRMM